MSIRGGSNTTAWVEVVGAGAGSDAGAEAVGSVDDEAEAVVAVMAGAEGAGGKVAACNAAGGSQSTHVSVIVGELVSGSGGEV